MNLGLIVGSLVIGTSIVMAANVFKPSAYDPLRTAEHGRYEIVAENDAAAWLLDTVTGEVRRCQIFANTTVAVGEGITVCLKYDWSPGLVKVK